MPDADTGHACFAGGEAGASAVSDWADAIDELEKYGIQIVAAPSTGADIREPILAHCEETGSARRKKERAGGGYRRDLPVSIDPTGISVPVSFRGFIPKKGVGLGGFCTAKVFNPNNQPAAAGARQAARARAAQFFHINRRKIDEN